MPNLLRALSVFHFAKAHCETSSRQVEIRWQRQVLEEGFTEGEFLREVAWVILCTGFRESTVRRHFDFISLAFCDWESAREIVVSGEICIAVARRVFANEPKLRAILDVAKLVDRHGIEYWRREIRRDPTGALRELPFVGPVTWAHVAKNLGLDVAKPDRHLARLAKALNYETVDALCRDVGAVEGLPVSIVDLIYWRYLADVTIRGRLPLGLENRSSSDASLDLLR